MRSSGRMHTGRRTSSFRPSFFDPIAIDKCHRGCAAEDTAWREIPEYFSAAIRIGLTATPKETKYVSNTAYFGEPVYSFSLKQGIRDGFLAPCKVVKVHIDHDVEGCRLDQGQLDREGKEGAGTLEEFSRIRLLNTGASPRVGRYPYLAESFQSSNQSHETH